MADAAAISLATDGAKAMGELLTGRAIEEMKLMWGLKDELEKLKIKFSGLQLFLKDVGSARHADKRGQVSDWLLKVKDAVYVADDIIDDYEYEIIRREREQKKQFVKKFRAFFSRNNHPIVFRIRMSHKVRDALAAFDDLQKKAQDMGLNQLKITAVGMAETSVNNNEGNDILSEARRHASANAAEIVGREDEMKELIEIMCRPSNEEAHISTVAILGLGGLGKTTFARCLYDSKDIDAHFQKKLWITVSDNFTILRILNEMLEYVTSNKGNLSNIDAIINKLQENLKNKKYLLVLDDVWCDNQELWSSLKNALQRIGGLPGCLILITTRLIEVTTGSQAVYTHSLRELSQGEGWALLKKRALVGVTYPNISEFEEIGKRIVEKCKGVPLAIKAIGAILQSKRIPSDWELIEKSEIWDLPQNDENQILPSLRLTFDHLPSPAIKQCFAYCPAFSRKGWLMQKDELVCIWLAQGFLHGSEIKNLTMEEIGEKYLMVLLNYSLLDEVNGKEPGYKMHDLVYDLAVDVCGKDLLLWKPEDHHKIDRCRHLVMSNKKDVEALSNIPITKTLRKLRTISNGLPHNVLTHAKYLRTLTVDRCEIEELPSSIGLLTHLRFLSLSHNPIKTLPDSIRKLYLLQTLRLLNCYNMKVLPAILYKLTNLIHIPTSLMLAARGLRELTNLHTLPRLALGGDDDGWSIDELGGMQNLTGEIDISGLEHVKTKENARKANLAGKAMVSNITLAWDWRRDEISDGSNDEDVLDGLQPHPNITSLELQNFFGLTFPSWMMRMAVVSEGGSPSPLKNLTSLKLLNCKRCEMLPTLGHLPCLKYLVLSGLKVKSIGSDFYGAPLNESNNKVNRVSFPSLTELEISHFKSLKTWVLPSTGEETIVFPLLDVIKLRNCPELETIPALDYFQSLKTLQLDNVGIQSLEISGGSSDAIDADVLDGLQPHPNIISLELQNFFGLTFPSWMLRMAVVSEGGSSPSLLKNLTSFKLVNCSRCERLPTLGHLPCLKYLYLSGLKVESIGSDFYGVPLNESNNKVNRVSFPSLTKLEISYCELLKTWVLPSTGEETIVFPLLAVIKLTNCPELETIPALDDFQSLKTLQLHKVGIKSLDITKHRPSSMLSPKVNLKLETLYIYYCEKLVSLPSELQFVASLKTVKVCDCPALTSLPNDLFNGLTSLTWLLIWGCKALSNIPTSLEKCVSLATLGIGDCPSIKGPMPDFSQLKGLKYIYKSGNSIELMISMLKAVEHLPNLTTLRTGGFSDEEEQELYFSDVSPIQQNQSLRHLHLNGSPNIKSLPEQLQLLTQIKSLTIWEFDDLEELPEWVGRLSSLEELWLDSCKKLKDIPSKEVFLQMTRLRKLDILFCPILGKSCVGYIGSNWSNSKHGVNRN